ncbi:MAG: Ig-like domain-containing protein [Actinomycetota bacterium]
MQRFSRRAARLAAVGTIAVAGIVVAAPADAAPVAIGLDCEALLPGVPPGSGIKVDGDPVAPGRQPQMANFEVQAPAEVGAGTELTLTLPGGSTVLPATSTGLVINSFTNITSTYRVTGGTIVDGSAVASGPPLINGAPGTAGTPVYTSDTLTISTTTPVPGGGTLTSPVVTFKVLAGAVGTTIQTSLVGNTLTANLAIGLAAATTCVAPPNALVSAGPVVLSSTLVVAPPPPPPPPGAPTAVNDTASTPAGAPVTINVLANDTAASDRAIDPASLKIKTAPTKGTATVGAGGITYTPNAGFSGGDTFQYEVCSVGIPVTTTSTSSTTSTTVEGQEEEETTTTTTTVAPTVLDQGPCHFANVTVTVSSIQGTTVPTVAPEAPVTAPPATLPVTGGSSAPLGLLGALLVGVGAGAMALVRRHRPITR